MLFRIGATSTVTVFYDPLGRLFSLTASGTTSEFLYDGDALVGGICARQSHRTLRPRRRRG